MNQLCAILALGAFGSLASSCVSSRAHYVPTSSAAERHGPAHDRRTVRTEEPESYDGRVEIVHFTLGEFELRDEAFWEPLDQPFSLGLDYSSTSTEDGLGAELGFQFWGDSTGGSFGDLDLSGVELSAGMRSTWNSGERAPHPYVGVGAAFLAANVQGPGYDESDGSFGLYGHAGITIPVGPVLELGLDYRMVRGTEAQFDGFVDSDFDYNRVSLVVGWSF